MFKPDKSLRLLAAARSMRRTGALVLLLASLAAAAGVVQGDRRAPAAASPAARDAKAAYQLRCWQYGKLLFEEYLAALPAESRASVRLSATDRKGGPLQLVEMQTATCLIRSAPADERPGSADEHGAAR